MVAWHKSDCECQLTRYENLGRHATHLTTIPLPATTKECKWRKLPSGGHPHTGREFLPGLLQKCTRLSTWLACLNHLPQLRQALPPGNFVLNMCPMFNTL